MNQNLRIIPVGGRIIMKFAASLIIIAMHLTVLASSSHAQFITVFSWATHNWTPGGALTQSYPGISGGNINFTVTGLPTGPVPPAATSFLNQYNGAGTNTPNRQNGNFGGLTNTFVLAEAMNQPNRTNTITTRIDFTHTGGVKNVSFSIFDIDKGSYEDQITVTAWYNNAQVMINNIVTATGSVNNSVANNNSPLFNSVVTGTASSGDSTSLSNATFTTLAGQIIDRIDITYGNGSGANQNPGQQWIFLSDISFMAVIPEPSTYMLIGAMGLGYFSFRNIRRKKTAVTDEAKAEDESAMTTDESAVAANVE